MQFDVWINNGPGGNTTVEHVQALLDSGVRLFCGAANNLLQMSSREAALQKIFESGGWVWPDEAASGGGWTLAVFDVYRRSQGQRADDSETEAKTLETITSRNSNLVNDVLQELGGGAPAGKDVWERVNSLIDARAWPRRFRCLWNRRSWLKSLMSEPGFSSHAAIPHHFGLHITARRSACSALLFVNSAPSTRITLHRAFSHFSIF